MFKYIYIKYKYFKDLSKNEKIKHLEWVIHQLESIIIIQSKKIKKIENNENGNLESIIII